MVRMVAVTITPEILWTLPRVAAPVTAGGGRVVVPVTTYDIAANIGSSQIWLVDGDGSRKPLTAGEFNASKPAVDPSGSRLAFVASVGDDKVKQIYVSDLDALAGPNSTKALTSFPLGALGGRWLPDGRSLVVLAYVLKGHLDLEATAGEVARRKDAKFVVHTTEDQIYRYWDTWLTTGEVPHLFRVDVDTGQQTDLTPGSTRWWSWPNTDDPLDSFAISPDGRHITFVANSSEPPHRRIRRHLYELDLETAHESDLTPEGVVQVHRPRYSPDGNTIAYGFQVVPDYYGDPIKLGLFDRSTAAHMRLAEGWDRSADQWEFDGRGDLLIIAEDSGYSHLFRLTGIEPVLEPIALGGSLTSPVVDGDGTVFLLRHSLHQPPEVVRLGANGELVPLTDFAASLLDDISWGAVEDLTFAGADGEPVQMFLIQPSGADPGGPPPLLHLIHGGPHGAFTDGMAMAVACPVLCRPRLPGGNGQLPRLDLVRGRVHLVDPGCVGRQALSGHRSGHRPSGQPGPGRRTRMAVAGGSYGGYLVAFITGQTNRYACAVAHAAVTNFGGMYASDITGGRALAYGSEIFEDRPRVERYSPSSHASGYNTPTLVIHGERDYRVPLTQGLELYGVLKAKEVPARLVYYPSENHWILNPQPSLHWYEEVFSWLDVYLR